MVKGLFERAGLQRPQADAAARLEVFEGQVAQLFQVAEGEQAPVHLLADLALTAGADLQLAEIGMTEGQIDAQVAQAAAVWAVRITGQAGIPGRVLGLSVR